MKMLPKARSKDIVVQTLNKELLVYDLQTDQAFCLNDTSAIIFNACDGTTSFDELIRKYNFTDELIHFALDQLHKNNLLAEIEGGYQSIFSGMSRREVIKKIGFATSVAISLPYIMGAAAPTPAQSASAGCPPGSPVPNGAPAGSPIGNHLTVGGTCATFSNADKDAACEGFCGIGCCSSNAVNAPLRQWRNVTIDLYMCLHIGRN